MAAQPRPDIDETRLAAAFSLVERQVASGRVRSAALAVGRADGPVRSTAFGPEGPFDDDRRFLVASITKPVTATAIMQLVEEGRLVLTAPLADYLPEFRPLPARPGTPGGETITTWHILTHTSGLCDAGEAFLETRRPTPGSLLERICMAPLAFVPGTQFGYASDSFYLLAELIGRLSGVGYPEYLRRRIFEPLGMSATTFDPTEPGPRALPLGGMFDRYGPLLGEATRYFNSLAMPGGGLWSAVGDFVRFGRSMLGGGSLDGARILGRPFVELMTREHTTDVVEPGMPPRRPHYGLGWARPGLRGGSPASPAAFGHEGATGTALLIDPDCDLVVVYLRNEWDSGSVAADEAVQAVYGALV